MKREYIRDKRSPKPSSESASKLMSQIKSKNTKPEVTLRRLLFANDLRGFRLHWKIPGRPDIAYVSKRLAIFVHGCYWHRCPYCNLPLPRSNSTFWLNKFVSNQTRDSLKSKTLTQNDWRVIVIWECQIKKNPQKAIKIIRNALTK